MDFKMDQGSSSMDEVDNCWYGLQKVTVIVKKERPYYSLIVDNFNNLTSTHLTDLKPFHGPVRMVNNYDTLFVCNSGR